jgi:uncharacterized protein YukE
VTIEVDPAQMLDCMGNIDVAVGRVDDLVDRFERVNDDLQSGSCMSQDEEADDKFRAFTDTLKDEIRILGDMLSAFQGCLTQVADAFAAVDEELARALTPSDSPMPTASGDVAV